MNDIILPVIIGVVAIIVGYGIAKILEKNKASHIIKSAKKRATAIAKQAGKDAESLKKDKMLQAKEKFLELKAEHERVILNRDKKISEAEKRTREKESKVSSELAKTKNLNSSLESKKNEYNERLTFLDKRQAEIDKMHRRQVEQLEVISSLSADDAKAQLMESIKDEAKTDAMAYIQNSLEEAKLTAQQEAKKVVINTIQRIGTEEAVENCVSVFNLESDDVKGRIIGREGRNIRAIEAATGVEIIVDDTPDAIILSCFDSVRREIARLSLHKLVTDGRIHPARIEEIVKKTKNQIEEEIKEVGKRTVIDLGIHGLHPELIKEYSDILYQLINYRWTQKLEDLDGSPRISKKIRGVDRESTPKRQNLKSFHKYLDIENPERKCFITGDKIPDNNLSVDHVIPWSYMYSDDLWNLVYVNSSQKFVKFLKSVLD